MKSIMKKIIAVFAVLCVTAASFASCSSSKEESSQSSEKTTLSQEEIDGLMRQPLSIGEASDGQNIAVDPNANLDAEDPVAESTTTTEAATTADTTKKADIAPVTTIENVTDDKGETVTTVVEVTDANGEVQTDADNKPVTEVVPVTKIATVTTEASEEETTEEETTTKEAATESSYQAKNDGRYAMWLDVSKDANFFFEGDMLEITFKVKEDIPDGDYKIRISPDLSDVTGTTVNPDKVIEGTIRVNNGEIDAADVSSETGLVFYGDNVACKQGDEITFHINIKNNPGLVAFVIWFYFDSNALEYVDAHACGEYEEIAKQTEVG